MRKRNSFHNTEDYIRYLEELVTEKDRQLKVSGEKHQKMQNRLVGKKAEQVLDYEDIPLMERQRLARMHGSHLDCYTRVQEYQNQLAEIKKKKRSARGINQREELKEERKRLVALLHDAQLECGKMNKTIRKIKSPLAKYFYDLLRSEDVLGEKYFQELWEEAQEIRDQAIRKTMKSEG